MDLLGNLESAVEKIKKKNEAKRKYKEIKNEILGKNPCEYCVGASAEIKAGDTICIEKVNPKKFCTDPWHETVGVAEKFDGRRITFLGYDELIRGFNVQKVCPICHRIIFSTTF